MWKNIRRRYYMDAPIMWKRMLFFLSQFLFIFAWIYARILSTYLSIIKDCQKSCVCSNFVVILAIYHHLPCHFSLYHILKPQLFCSFFPGKNPLTDAMIWFQIQCRGIYKYLPTYLLLASFRLFLHFFFICPHTYLLTVHRQ